MSRKFFLPKLHIELERWRYYLPLDIYVSNLGNIRDANGERQKVCVSNGYIYYRGRRVHRIVLETWNPVPDFAELTVDHLNHNIRDNRVSNLEWVSLKENTKRDAEDRTGNLPDDNGAIYVMLNGAKIPLNSAKKIIAGDKSIRASGGNVDKVFEKVKQSNSMVAFGNFTIQRCA